MTKEKGYVSFILHAHLPFIHHPESEDYLEEEWLYEAISETYLPLLTNFGKLEKEKVDFRITMSLTPPLLNMLDNKLLQERYIKYLQAHIELSKKEVVRNADNERVKNLAQYYVDRYSNDLHIFKDVKTNIVTPKDITSISFLRNMGRIYNLYDLQSDFNKNSWINSDHWQLDLKNPSSSNPSSTFR